jgi:Zn-dependent alcohol dehydrogenase
MRAVVLEQAGQRTSVEDLALEAPRAGEVLVRMRRGEGVRRGIVP